MRKSARTLIAPFLVALLAACSNDSGPYLDVTGGSFVFNFRLATASAGIIVVAERELPEGSAVEVAFEDCDPNVDCQPQRLASTGALERQIGRASCRERV